MVVAITIRNVPEEVRDELAARAARSGRSLQEYLLIHFADMVSRPSVDDIVAQVRARVAAAGTELSIADVLAARDADRR